MKRIFISFDYDDDKNYKNLLAAFAKNPRSNIEFTDVTPKEIQSNNISKIKGVLTKQIREATHTLVLIGKHANSYHPDSNKIGELNWQWWEINKSYEEGKKFIAVRIKSDTDNNTPEPLYRKGATWANSFTVDAILNAIDKA